MLVGVSPALFFNRIVYNANSTRLQNMLTQRAYAILAGLIIFATLAFTFVQNVLR